ncbi:efflux RND transporter permease subunit [Sphingomonas desiccabilis]|uniref:Efflux RND transporter permease subunit n=1 Tax=Sphingomonas desiccabilis TaxID=429134 RepID=A0A4V1QNT0_9SPHN|nr:efflux RND transporter permease subunit [Sphingomonas desiccabilis]MBB3912350.1 multidrug efflux pump subunit AcrB [Sphingomonas desiccabilis]RXZ30491.1 efflux RND transporter permease subunit [Sphingomonas desiccabilis]
MGFRNISAWSIRNPIPPLVLFIALTIAGLVSFMRMDVNQDPDIEFPVVIVVINQPGAAPTELETQITQRVEAAVRSIQGIDEINSEVSEGNSTTIVQLDIGTPIDRAVTDVREAVNQIRSELPEGILEPQIYRANTTDKDLASWTAIANDMTEEQLSWYVDNTVAKELLSIDGMSTVERVGGVDREIRVILDPARLQGMGITASQVNQALRQVNINAAGGRAEIAGQEQSVRVLGNAATAYELGQTQIALGGGRTVRLADIAEVRDAYAEQRSAAAYNGRRVLSFDIKRAKGASDVTVFHEAEKRLKALEERNPQVRFALLSDSVKYTEIQYESAIHAMIEGAVLAVVIVFLFLWDWRATLISALAIPLSAIPTFWFMDLMGFSLNQMTLLALSLVAGVLVDDAIVEIENIVRHMRMGKSAYQASIDAADEIGLAVLATTMAIVAVFLPVGLMPGIAGQFFKNFGLTVVAAVLMSLGVARMITPMIAAYFLKGHGHVDKPDGWAMRAYMGTLRWTLKHRWTAVVASIGAFAGTLFMFSILPATFQPPQDRDRSTAMIEMVPGTTLEQTARVVKQVEEILRAQPIVTSAYSTTMVGSGRVSVELAEDRKMTSTEFERGLAPRLSAIPDARVAFRSQFGWGSNNRDVSIVLGGDDPVLLNETANKLVQEMAGLKTIVAPRISGDLQRPELVIRPRLDLAASLGVTTSALSNAIRIATLGDIDQNSARFSLSDRQIPIRVALSEDSRTQLSTIQNLPVPTSSGGSVPLSVVAEIGFGAGPTKIERVDQQRQLVVGADLAPGVVNSDAMKQIHALPTMQKLPIGVRELTLGQAKWQTEMIQNFIIAVISGLLLLLAVLVLLYKRLMPPFVNIGSLLLAPLGGLIALWVTGHPVSMPVYIGLLMLLGIVAKNSILLIDFALEEMAKGVDKSAAILDAGHKRAQPIVMTTVAMVAGMVPTALALTGDASFRAPMSITVIGGLVLSTMLTLLIVPATFSLAVGVERWVGPRLSRRLLTYRPGDEIPGQTVIDHKPGGHIGYHGKGQEGPAPAE